MKRMRDRRQRGFRCYLLEVAKLTSTPWSPTVFWTEDRQLNENIIPAFKLFVTTYPSNFKLLSARTSLCGGGAAAMKGIKGIILRVGTVLLGTAAYALIGMAITAAG